MSNNRNAHTQKKTGKPISQSTCGEVTSTSHHHGLSCNANLHTLQSGEPYRESYALFRRVPGTGGRVQADEGMISKCLVVYRALPVLSAAATTDRPTDLLFNVNSAPRSRALESVPGSSNGDRSFVHFGNRCAEHAPLRRYEGAYKRERKARLVVLVSRVYGYGRKRARSRFCVGPELGSWPALVGSAVSRRILVQCTRCVSK